jgi:hypothetical protein
LTTRLHRLCLAALLTAVSISGCGSAEPPAGTVDPAGSAAPQRPLGSTQAFEIIDFKAFDSIDSAIWRFQVSCAAKRGFKVAERPIYDSGSRILQKPALMGDVTEVAARRNGLHDGPVTTETRPPRASQATSDALQECFTQAQAKLGADTQEKQERFTALVNELSSTFYATFNVFQDKLTVEQHQCAAAAGWKPADPAKLSDPAVSPASLFGVQTAAAAAGPGGAASYTPLPKEIDLAVALAKCRVDLKVVDRSMAEAIRIQEPIVARYEQRITELNREIRDLAKRAPEVLR